MVNEYIPALFGFPEMTPVDSSLRPFGSGPDPEASDHL
jgi:hypothetical protein